MLYEDSVPGEVKQQMQRGFAVENRGEIYNIIGLLTSDNPKGDLAQGQTTKIFPKTAKVFGIEGIKKRRDKVAKFLKKQAKNSTFIGKMLHSIDFGKYLDDEERLEYLGCDMCGNLTVQTAASFYINQEHFADGMRFPVTIKAVDRKDNVQRAIERVERMDYIKQLEKWFKDTPFTIPFGMSQDLKRNMYTQIYLLIHSMPSKDFIINRIIAYRNSDISSHASYMVFLDIELRDIEVDVRRRNRFERIINVYNSFCPTSQVTMFKPKKRGRPKIKRVKREAFHITLGFNKRSDMEKKGGKSKITKLARTIAKETGRDFLEVRGSMVAGLNRHFTVTK